MNIFTVHIYACAASKVKKIEGAPRLFKSPMC